MYLHNYVFYVNLLIGFIMLKPYFEKPRFKLFLGDSIEILKNISENSIDMIFADPPYFLSSGTFTCHVDTVVLMPHFNL